MHTKVVLARGHADGVVGSVKDTEPAAADVGGTWSVGYGLVSNFVLGRGRGSDANDVQEVFDASEVVDVARVEGQVGG